MYEAENYDMHKQKLLLTNTETLSVASSASSLTMQTLLPGVRIGTPATYSETSFLSLTATR